MKIHEIQNINKINNFQTQNTKENTAEKNPKVSTKRSLADTLSSLALLGASQVLKSPKTQQVTEENTEQTKEITINSFKNGMGHFEKGEAILNSGEKFTGELTKTGKDSEKYTFSYIDGKIAEAKKVLKDGTIDYIKKYKYEDGKKTVDIFKQDENGELTLSRTLVQKKDSIAQYIGGSEKIDKYYQKAGGTWHRVDEYIDKEHPAENLSYMQAKHYYCQSGREINMFLRSGEFHNYQFIGGKMPKEFPDDAPEYYKSVYNEAKEENRAILDKLPQLDEFSVSSILEEPTTVYRDAPSRWLDKAKDGILTDEAFCSTSTVPGASMEGLIGPDAKNNIRYTIHLPKGTKFADLRYTNEKEILLPRNSKFRIINGSELEYLGVE